ncbi:cytochrome c oxidase assembly protein COX16 homolog, mitochondrial isoform X3 [Pseudoliparis swirei]|uniref:cytochrome c oxidase assembly protein COX16 homolog, mitochondrial isoform X3 n=1 Tax=Pseudoliparis swirei TaxID=2059687 RepID=UPI0024BE0B7D|nr:cytochrome c oxidase assembly protein COX16 homolog, mitochondrial isoform X3 [Pseudoliparis swirei]
MFNLKALKKNKTLRYGVPMLLDPSLEAKVNVEKQSVILEEQYEKMQQVDLDEWKNIRGPRPWEDSKEYQEEQRSRQNKTD